MHDPQAEAKVERKPHLDLLVKASAIIPGGLIILGIIGGTIYYHAFSINILDFIGFTEAITLFLNHNFILLSATALGMISYRQTPKQDSKSATSDSQTPITGKSYWLFVFVAATAVLLSISMVNRSTTIFGIFLLMLVRLFAFYWLFNIIRIGGNTFVKLNYSRIVYAFVLLNLIFSVSEFNALKIKNHSEDEIQLKLIMLNGETVETGQDLVYVGKTEKYLFLHLKSAAETIVYNNHEIKFMAFKKPEDAFDKWPL